MWFAATFMLFFARAFMFSTWVSRGPEVQQLLDINTVEMGVFTMMYPIGGLLGINFASGLVQRFGSRAVALAAYLTSAAAMALLGPVISAGTIVVASVLLLVMGLPLAIVDFVGNYEGTLVDRASKRSVFSAIHGAYGLGMLSAAALSGALSGAGVSLTVNYIGIAFTVAIAAGGAALSLPTHPREVHSADDRARETGLRRRAWRERRSLTIAVIGFAFIMSEMTAGTWVPIALTRSGFSGEEAAYAFSFFWVAITLVRLAGGPVVDAIGRFRTVQLSAVVTSAGIAVFMLADVVSLPYLGLVLWGVGLALGFPMCIASMGDNPAMSAARINMIISVVYISSIAVGPAVGAVGQLVGIYGAFAIPLLLLLVSAFLSPATKPDPND